MFWHDLHETCCLHVTVSRWLFNITIVWPTYEGKVHRRTGHEGPEGCSFNLGGRLVGGGVNATPRPRCLRGNRSGTQGQSGRVRKISLPRCFDLRTVYSVASHYTNWAIPAHVCIYVMKILSKYCSHAFSNFTVKNFSFNILPRHIFSTRWRSWLRHCAASRKVAGSFPDVVTGIFQRRNPSGRTVALGTTQPVTEMSTRYLLGGKDGRCVGLTTLPSSCADWKSWDPRSPAALGAYVGL